MRTSKIAMTKSVFLVLFEKSQHPVHLAFCSFFRIASLTIDGEVLFDVVTAKAKKTEDKF